MTGILAWHLLRKDLGVGPRSPIFLYAIVLPVILTLLIRVVFGSLFDPVPRLGIVDEGESQVVQNVRDVEGIQVTFPESAAALKTLVENNDLDGGSGAAGGLRRRPAGRSDAQRAVLLWRAEPGVQPRCAGGDDGRPHSPSGRLPGAHRRGNHHRGRGRVRAHRLPPAAVDRAHGGAHRGRADPGHEPGGRERKAHAHGAARDADAVE